MAMLKCKKCGTLVLNNQKANCTRCGAPDPVYWNEYLLCQFWGSLVGSFLMLIIAGVLCCLITYGNPAIQMWPFAVSIYAGNFLILFFSSKWSDLIAIKRKLLEMKESNSKD